MVIRGVGVRGNYLRFITHHRLFSYKTTELRNQPGVYIHVVKVSIIQRHAYLQIERLNRAEWHCTLIRALYFKGTRFKSRLVTEAGVFHETYLLTPWCRVLLQKLTGLQLVKKFHAFHGTRRFITALTSVHHLSLSWASPIQSIYLHPTS